MHGTATLEGRQEAPLVPTGMRQEGRERVLAAVFATLDSSGIPYCLLDGYDRHHRWSGSDIDCVIGPDVPLGPIVSLLARNRTRIGAEVVRRTGTHIVLAARDGEGARFFLTLDLMAECALDGVVFYDGAELVAGRRKLDGFWVPAPNLEFGCRLVRAMAKGRLDDERAGRLSRLFRQDEAGCAGEVARFWGGERAGLIAAAARSGEWRPVRQRLPELAAELRRRALRRRPARLLAARLRGQLARLGRVLRPGGVYVAVLGPDGAGKSSLIAALEERLAGAFAGSVCYGFTPALIHHLRHGAYRENSDPHALPPRSWLMSAARALGYWLPYYTLGYLVRHLDLARSRLVTSDRHLADVLVDPRRYRYGGPMWLTRLVWRVAPKPDLVILLDAPAEVLQARKQDVPFEETARQRQAYLALVAGMSNGHVLDAARPLDEVAAEAGDLVLRHLAGRIARRYAVKQQAT
jgi:thymidylate kinase